MPDSIIYLDESGDLGWSFTQPYRTGGSSRYLTIGALIVPAPLKAHPKRAIKDLYATCRWDPKKEKKWSDMTPAERELFGQEAQKLKTKISTINYFGITVRKENVQPHIRADANKLYNYMVSQLLLDHIAGYNNVVLVPDNRSIKVKSGNSLHDYLQTQLWFEKKVKTALATQPGDSAGNLALQFADMLSGCIQSHFEDGDDRGFKCVAPCSHHKTLFF